MSWTEPIDSTEQALRDSATRSPAAADAHRGLGEHLLERDRPYEAIWAFQDALEPQPSDGRARRGVARALIAASLPRLALAALVGDGAQPAPSAAGAADRDEEEAEQRRVAAESYMAMGDAVGVIGTLSASRTPLDPPALLMLGHASEALGSEARAAQAYRQLLAAEPGSQEAYLGTARLAARRGLWKEATAAIEAARGAAPHDPRPLYQWAQTLAEQAEGKAASRQPEDSLRLLQRIAGEYPDFGPALMELGRRQLDSGRPAAAVPLLERAVALSASGAETRLQLARALDEAGQKATACYQRGLYFLQTQQHHRALPEFRRMAALDPGRPEGLLMLATAYARMDQHGEAAKVAGRALEQFPNDPQVLTRRAQHLIMAEDRAGAKTLCLRWLREQPQAAEPYRLLGSIARVELRHAEAVRLCEQAVERAPDSPECFLELARSLMGTPTTSNLRRAVGSLQRAIGLKPEDAEARLLLADALQRSGDLNGARDQFLRGMDRNPNDPRGVVGLSQLCPRLGKPGRVAFYGKIVRALHEREGKARVLWRRVYSNPGDVEAHHRLASLLLEAGELEQARHQLAQAAALDPEHRDRTPQLPVLERLIALLHF